MSTSPLVLLIISGATVNGPYGVVATAISSDLVRAKLLKRMCVFVLGGGGGG